MLGIREICSREYRRAPKKRLKHWRVLFALNWHYVVLKKKEPMIYKDINNIEKPKRKKKQEKNHREFAVS